MYFFGKFDFVEESAVENLILSRNPLFLSTDFLCKQAIHLLSVGFSQLVIRGTEAYFFIK